MSSIHKPEKGLPDPVFADISSLKAAVARYQNAADTAQIHLQRQALEMTSLATRCSTLEQENALLQKEIVFLRSNPETSSASSSASLQMSEMTLALRRVSDQLNSSEEAFRDQAEQLARAHSARSQSRHEVDAAHKMVTRIRVREEQTLERIRTLEFELKKKEEERKMADLVVREYADLVRTIEGRSSHSSLSIPAPDSTPSELTKNESSSPNGNVGHTRDRSHSKGSSSSQSKGTLASMGINGSANHTVRPNARSKPIDSLYEGRAGLQRLLAEFHEQIERLEEEIAKLHGEREIMEMKLAVCEQVTADDHRELADVKAELASALRADKSAAKMVERYMSFSQQSTNLLQTALQTQKKRHAATVETLERQISSVTIVAERERGISERLRSALDEMTIEISRESFGRRREISLRLSLAERERKIAQMLEKWINSMEQKSPSQDEEDEHLRYISTAKQIQSAIHGSMDQTRAAEGEDPRIQMALAAVQDLSKELEAELSKRMLLQRENADLKRFHAEFDSNLVENRSARTSASTEEVEAVTRPDSRSTGSTSDIPSDAHASDASPQRLETQDVSSVEGALPHANTINEEQITPEVSRAIESTHSVGSTLLPQHPQAQQTEQESERVAALRETSKRYDTLQRDFNDCHDALVTLQSSIDNDGDSNEDGTAHGYLVAAVERLHDYCEDARVELEILVADEARISQGYETLLSLSTGTPASGSSGITDEVISEEMHLLDEKIDAFVKGTLPSMEKARTLFEGKLDNLMHDIAIVKRALHEGMNPLADEAPSTDKNSNDLSTTNGNNFPADDSSHDENATESENQFTWRALASSLSPLSNKPHSADSRPAQSFGTLMASGLPRHSSSSEKPGPKSRRNTPGSNPLNHLGLRIAMPRVNSPQGQGSSTSFNIHSPFPFALRPLDSATPGLEGLPNSAPISRVASGWFPSSGISRARTVSNIHAVGFGVGMAISPRHPLDRTRSSASMIVPETEMHLNKSKDKAGRSVSAGITGLVNPKSEPDEVE